MFNLTDFLNKRHALRKLTDADFEIACSELAQQLVSFDYKPKYSDLELQKDWKGLCSFVSDTNGINSTVRHGMKISEHFMHNFYDISDNKGRSFANQWNYEVLNKVLRWNRKSHSTPYLSELKRGVYFCTGMTKNTMYRPSLAKMIVNKYAKGKYVLDPCCGWGGRMLGTVAAGSHYIGFEPNTETYNNLRNIATFLNITDNVTLYNDIAENIGNYTFHEVDLILTSPPYYNLEIYSTESSQSVKPNQTYQQWSDAFLMPVIKLCIGKGSNNVVSAWNVANFGKVNMVDDVKNIHNSLSYDECDMFYVCSSKRQSNQNANKNAKNIDCTVCYNYKKQ